MINLHNVDSEKKSKKKRKGELVTNNSKNSNHIGKLITLKN